MDGVEDGQYSCVSKPSYVALKFLPRSLAHMEEARERFTHPARDALA